MKILRVSRLLAAALLASSLLSCSARNAETRSADTFVLGWIAGPDGFNPLTSTNSAATMAEQLIYTPLIDIGPNLRPRYATSLARSVKIDNGGRRYTVYLRRGTRWSDGVAVTAKDVLFTIAADSNPNVTQSVPARYSLMQSIHARDPYTIEIQLKSPSPPFLTNSLAQELPVPEHVLGRFAPGSAQEAQYLNTETAFTQNPVTDGPFKIERNVRDSYLILAHDPGYWGPFTTPYRYAFRVYPQQDSLYAAVDAAEVDLTDIPPNLWRIHDRLKGAHAFVTWPWNVTFMLLPNFADPDIAFMHERAVRQAIMYATNREFIIHGIMSGQADLLNGPLPTFSPYYDPRVKRYPYDPQKAAALLDAAGWRMQGNVRVKNGKPLHFVLKTGGATDAVASNIAELIQANLRAVGIDCELQNEEITTFFADLHALKFSVALRGRILPPYPDDFPYYDSTQTRKAGGYNYGAYANAQVDDALEKARSAPSPREARAQLNRYEELAAEDLPVLYLYSNRLGAIVPPGLRGLELTPQAPAAVPMGLQFWRPTPSSEARR